MNNTNTQASAGGDLTFESRTREENVPYGVCLWEAVRLQVIEQTEGEVLLHLTTLSITNIIPALGIKKMSITTLFALCNLKPLLLYGGQQNYSLLFECQIFCVCTGSRIFVYTGKLKVKIS